MVKTVKRTRVLVVATVIDTSQACIPIEIKIPANAVKVTAIMVGNSL